jgi:hypothetical protein
MEHQRRLHAAAHHRCLDRHCWRSFFGGLFLLIPLLALNGRQSLRQLARIGWPGLLLAASNIVCQACTVAVSITQPSRT